jgi:hypothetical protein
MATWGGDFIFFSSSAPGNSHFHRPISCSAMVNADRRILLEQLVFGQSPRTPCCFGVPYRVSHAILRVQAKSGGQVYCPNRMC